MGQTYYIPSGKYCFESIRDNGGRVYQVRHCPYWSLKIDNEYVGHCRYLNESDNHTVRFQEKICGENL